MSTEALEIWNAPSLKEDKRPEAEAEMAFKMKVFQQQQWGYS